jgi:hypothetical protein
LIELGGRGEWLRPGRGAQDDLFIGVRRRGER